MPFRAFLAAISVCRFVLVGFFIPQAAKLFFLQNYFSTTYGFSGLLVLGDCSLCCFPAPAWQNLWFRAFPFYGYTSWIAFPAYVLKSTVNCNWNAVQMLYCLATQLSADQHSPTHFWFFAAVAFCIAIVMLQVFSLSAFGLLCISFSNFYRLLFTAFHRLLFPWACISGFYSFIWVGLLSLLPCPIASVVVFCWILIIRNVGLYFPFFPIIDLVCFSVVRTSYCYGFCTSTVRFFFFLTASLFWYFLPKI